MKETIDIYLPHEGKVERTKEVTTLDQLREIHQKSLVAQQKWQKLSLDERSRILMKVVHKLHEKSHTYAEKISRYNGKTPYEAMISEVFPTISSFEYFAGKVRNKLRPKNLFLPKIPIAKSQVHFMPLGIVGIIAPWNYPFKLALQDVPAALMAGNSVILKPSEHSAAIGEIIEELFKESALPEHLVQCVYGYGNLGQALLEEELVQKISFIGSHKTGKFVGKMAAERLIPCTLELGGKDAAIILDDCNIEKTVRGITWGAFTNCGQTCASIELVFVPRKLQKEFTEKLVNFFNSLDKNNFGVMNTAFQKEIVQKQIDDSLKKGAKILAQKELGQKEGKNPFAIDPIILSELSTDSEMLHQETFGPTLPLIVYDKLEEVFEALNKNEYGLTTSVWTKDPEGHQNLIPRINSGVVTFNDHMITPGLPEAPWLGHKKSGMGYSSSEFSLRGFTKMRYVYHDRNLIRYKFWQYPFSKKKSQWVDSYQDSAFAKNCLTRLFYKIVTMPTLLFKS